MNLNTGKFESENTWQETGGGLSQFEPRPYYQDGIAFIVGLQRGVPDVSAEGNLYTGVWVLDSLVLRSGCLVYRRGHQRSHSRDSRHRQCGTQLSRLQPSRASQDVFEPLWV